MFRVIDLKQYDYCPRIFYYHTILPEIRPITYKMEAGIATHTAAEQRQRRRSLRLFGLDEGTPTFNIALKSEKLGLSGEIDMLIDTDAEIIPVDFKQAKRASSHFRLQLAAYGQLLQEHNQKPVKRGFLYLIPPRKAIEVRFTPHLRRRLVRSVEEMGRIFNEAIMPSPTRRAARCVDCEFRRFCNDML